MWKCLLNAFSNHPFRDLLLGLLTLETFLYGNLKNMIESLILQYSQLLCESFKNIVLA